MEHVKIIARRPMTLHNFKDKFVMHLIPHTPCFIQTCSLPVYLHTDTHYYDHTIVMVVETNDCAVKLVAEEPSGYHNTTGRDILEIGMDESEQISAAIIANQKIRIDLVHNRGGEPEFDF